MLAQVDPNAGIVAKDRGIDSPQRDADRFTEFLILRIGQAAATITSNLLDEKLWAYIKELHQGSKMVWGAAKSL